MPSQASTPPTPPPATTQPPPTTGPQTTGPAPAPVSPRPIIPTDQKIGGKVAGTVKPGQVAGKLTQAQRVWADNVLLALKLKSKTSQARVLAGAIASAELMQRDPARSANEKADAVAQLKIVRAAGDPPWKDMRKAMAATSAKVQLDLLSIPGPRQIDRRRGPVTAMQTYFLERQDADGKGRTSFVVKPAARRLDENEQVSNAVSGIPNGGEIVRESLSARAAQNFASQTGLDVGMPETHVVSLDPGMLPGVETDLAHGKALCSVQEFSPDCREFRSVQNNPATRIPLDRDQVAALAVFDLMTINTDRHGGNILVDPSGRLVPIDHGACFPQATAEDDVRGRIMSGFGGPHNAVLGLPEAHEPLSPAVAKKLKAMKSTEYGNSLRKDKRDITAVHPGTATALDEQKNVIDALSDASIDLAQMAARFAKLSARNNPPLAPANMQITYASNVDVLQAAWNADTFDNVAKPMIAEAAQTGTITKKICLMTDLNYQAMYQSLKDAGWWVAQRGPPGRTFADPVLMMAIMAQGSPPPAAPSGGLDAQLAQARIYAGQASPATLMATLLNHLRNTCQRMIALLPTADRGAATTALNGVTGAGEQAADALTNLIAQWTDAAVAEQNRLLAIKVAAGVVPNKQALVKSVESAAADRDPLRMGASLGKL